MPHRPALHLLVIGAQLVLIILPALLIAAFRRLKVADLATATARVATLPRTRFFFIVVSFGLGFWAAVQIRPHPKAGTCPKNRCSGGGQPRLGDGNYLCGARVTRVLNGGNAEPAQ